MYSLVRLQVVVWCCGKGYYYSLTSRPTSLPQALLDVLFAKLLQPGAVHDVRCVMWAINASHDRIADTCRPCFSHVWARVPSFRGVCYREICGDKVIVFLLQ